MFVCHIVQHPNTNQNPSKLIIYNACRTRAETVGHFGYGSEKALSACLQSFARFYLSLFRGMTSERLLLYCTRIQQDNYKASQCLETAAT